MTREELVELIAKRLIENADRPGLTVSAFPVDACSFAGMGVHATAGPALAYPRMHRSPSLMIARPMFRDRAALTK